MFLQSLFRTVRKTPTRMRGRQENENSAPIEKLANRIIVDAHVQGASEIHLQLQEFESASADPIRKELQAETDPIKKELLTATLAFLEDLPPGKHLYVLYKVAGDLKPQFAIPRAHFSPLLDRLNAMMDENRLITFREFLPEYDLNVRLKARKGVIELVFENPDGTPH